MDRKELTDRILELEWDMFTHTTNAGGRASCQDDRKTFFIMRRAQADSWSKDMLISYKNDLENAAQEKINLVAIKYARMMKTTFPSEYEAIKDKLPVVSSRAAELADEITKRHLKWSREASEKYPKLFLLGRPLTDIPGSRFASIENYLHSELLTYSEATLELCLRDTLKAESAGGNLSLEVLKNTAQSYGYQSLDAIENAIKEM